MISPTLVCWYVSFPVTKTLNAEVPEVPGGTTTNVVGFVAIFIERQLFEF